MNAQAKPLRQLKRLDAKQMYQLTQLVEKHYAEKAMTDKEFAAWVTEALGTPVGESSIVTARNTLGIPSTKECISSGGQEVAQLRMMVVNLTERMRVLEIAVQSIPSVQHQAKIDFIKSLPKSS